MAASITKLFRIKVPRQCFTTLLEHGFVYINNQRFSRVFTGDRRFTSGYYSNISDYWFDNKKYQYISRNKNIESESESIGNPKANNRRWKTFQRSPCLTMALPGVLGYFWKKFDEEEDEEEDNIVLLLKRGVLSHMRGEYEKSESFFHEALGEVEEKHQTGGFGNNVEYLHAKINVYSRMGALEMSRGDLEKAELLYKDTMRLCLETGVEETDNSIVELSFKLATLYAMKGDDVLAEMGYEHCMEVQSQKVNDEENVDEDTIALLGMVAEGYGRYLLDKKHYPLAEKHFKQAFEIGRKLFGPSHAQTMVLLNNVAVVGILQGRYEVVKMLLTQNIAIGELEKSEELGALYSNLGSTYLRTRELDKAYAACSEALKFGEEFDNDHVQKIAKRCLAKVSKARREEKTEEMASGAGAS